MGSANARPTDKPHNIGIFGTSAGAILTAEVAVRLEQLKLPLPPFSASSPSSPTFPTPPTLNNSSLSTAFPALSNRKSADEYAAKSDLKDPVLSYLRRSKSHAAQPPGHQQARPPPLRQQCPAGCLRGSSPRLLVPFPTPRNPRGPSNHGEFLHAKSRPLSHIRRRVSLLRQTTVWTPVSHGVLNCRFPLELFSFPFVS